MTDSKIPVRLYAPENYFGIDEEFHPFNENGSIERKVKCNFKGSKVCTVSLNQATEMHGWSSPHINNLYSVDYTIPPDIRIKKGDQKKVDPRVRETFLRDCKKSIVEINEMIETMNTYIEVQKSENNTPFIPVEKRDLVLDAFYSFLRDLENHKLNAEHQLKKVESHALS